MIKYSLKCKDCSSQFESWFASSEEFDRLKKLKLLNCQDCDSLKVDKSLMSPNLVNTKKNDQQNNEKYKKVKKKLQDYQKFVKENFDYVGDNFSYEARSIHYNQKKTKKGIYGKASVKEVNELKEEGIETETIPWIEENEN
ncbi:MAG: hypothetical protein CMF54_03880 [Legionellales bacterium]|nr:hypothetical protein [Legionellales bacterium]|tara:strand:+ start:102 stop:524 length:423 start_codon:yes stop_codon:yes gene_type:complete